MKPFSLLVKPASADCNLRCTYCFYLKKHALYPHGRVHRMSEAVLDRMLRTFMATEQPVHAFGWQGGEPTLMGVEFFRRVTALQERYGARGAQVSNGLQTNTTLIDDALAEHLHRYHFLVGVSLDGPAELHNRFRVYADGRGAHAAVLDGIDTLRRHAVEFNVLTLVSQANVRHARDVYGYLCDMGVMHHQYIECVEFDDDDGGMMPFAVTGEQWGEFLCELFDAWYPRDTRRVSVRLFDAILVRMVDGYANTCVLGDDCRQYLLVEHNGDVYPCDFFVEPEWKLGNLMTDTWEQMLASPLYAAFGKRKARRHERCEACEWLPLCAGCCPKNRPTRGADPQRLSVLCDGWRRFFEHTRARFEKLADGIRRERDRAQRLEQQRQRLSQRTAAPGRNDPCPCGSGRKFKRCCGA